jgi:hypothetical protein
VWAATSRRLDDPECRWNGAGGRWKDLKLNAAFHFPHPAFHEKRHEVPLADGVREVGDSPDFSDRYGRAK